MADDARNTMIGLSAAFAAVGAVFLMSMVNNYYIMKDYGRSKPLSQAGRRNVKIALMLLGMAALALNIGGDNMSLLFMAHMVLYGVILYDYVGRSGNVDADKLPGAGVKKGLLIAGIFVPLLYPGLFGYALGATGAGIMADRLK